MFCVAWLPHFCLTAGRSLFFIQRFFSRSWFNVFTLFASPFTCVFVMLGHVNLGLKYLSWCVCECILALFVICLFIFSEYIFVFAFRRRVCVRFVCAFVWSAEEKDDDWSWADFKTDARLCVVAGTRRLNSFHISILKIKVFLIITLMMSVRNHRIWPI